MNHTLSLRLPVCIGGVATLACLANISINAQIVSTNAPTTMQKTVVEGLSLDETILPTARPLDSVLGDERSIIDTPRSVTLVTKAQMEARNISRTTDFGQYSPGVYTPSRYGLAGVPVIRGDLAEIYQNGQRVVYNRNSILPSFNGVEALDIVKGPGSAVYGPQGQGPGGYVNFVTKVPYFDGFHGDVMTKWGTYVPGGQSFFSPEWTLDFGGPINEKLAYRVSYLGRESDTYYRNTKDNTQDIFAALTWRPNEAWTFDWNAQFYTQRINEVVGVNRVTQELIDSGIYNAGPVLPTNAFGDPLTSIGAFGSNSSFALLDLSKTKKVHIYPYQTLNGPSDSSGGHLFRSQLISTYVISDSAKIINRSLGETQETKKQSGYGYTENVPTDWMVNNRTELHYELEPKLGDYQLPIKTISGVDLRYSKMVSYQDFSTEPFFLYDLTGPTSAFRLPSYTPGTSYGGGFNIPGQPGYGGNPFPSSGNQDTELTQAGFFTQWDLQLHEKVSIVLGGRGDYFDATSASPVFVEKAKGGFYNASASVLNGSVFVSGIYKFTPKVSGYVTYDVVNAVAGSSNFGGVDGTGGVSGLKRSLSTESEVIEIGSKASLFENTFFASATGFTQSRLAPQLKGPPIGIDTRGIELEAYYQPNRNFNASANLTAQEAYQGDTGYQQTGNYLDGYPTTFTQDGQSGTGKGSPNYNFTPRGKVRAASVPKFLFNTYLTYQLDSGLGASIGPQFQGSQWQNQQGTLIIPAQYTINAFVFYKQPKWEVQVNFFNITDQRNWTSIDPGFAGNDVIYPEQPFRVSGQLKFKF
jgi:outer membrane receptor for monomeric catechols